MTTQPVVEAWTNGALNTHWTGTISLTSSGGSLTNCSAIAVTGTMSGTATFTSCKFAGGYYYNPISEVYLATPYTLTASATNSVATSPVTSSAFGVTGPGTANSLVFSTQPSGAAGPDTTPFPTQPVVTVEDSFGNIVNASSAPVTLAISSGSLTCTANPLAASDGSASFSGCAGNAYGNGLTLTASSSGLSSTTSASFNITGLPTQLIFTEQPIAGVSGAPFTTQPVITVEDAGGSTVTASSTAITLTASGGSLQLCTNLTPYEGVVSVATCNFAGIVGTSYYLTATQGSLSATSGVFTPSAAGTPTQLVFTTEPVAGLAGSAFVTQPTISVEDSAGNVTTSDAIVTLASSGGSLLSCPAISAVEGVAEFSICAFGGLDTMPYTLTATSPGLSSVMSTDFTPSGPGPASASVSTFTASPAIVVDDGTTSASLTATLEDAYTNAIPGKTIAITQGATGSVVTAVSATTNASGVATFTATDTNREIVTFSATDSTDGVAISEQPQVSFATQLTPPTSVALSYGATSGSIGITFSAPSNAPSSGQTYTATACTTDTAGVLSGCNAAQTITSGGQLTGLSATQGSPGTPYYVTVTAVASTGYLASTSAIAGPQPAMSQVDPPTSVTLTSSTTTAGAINVTFAASLGTAPSSYSATACTTDTGGVLSGCSAAVAIVSGGQLTGLTAGTPYYVTVTANPPTGYLSATSAIAGPTAPTVQLAPPTAVALSYGATSGSIGITFSAPSNAPSSGQTYTATACTTDTAGVLSGCNAAQTITSGGQLTGLSATQGSPGTPYYVTVTAVASTGYLASTSAIAGPQPAMSQVDPPTSVTLTSSTTTAGAINVTFAASLGTAPSSYTATVCTSPGNVCSTHSNYVSNTQITGLTPGTEYTVTITAVPPVGYLSATSAQAGPVPATTQLGAPTNVTLSYGTTGGSIGVTFTAPTGGETYTATACTTDTGGVLSGCNAAVAITSGGQITGLTAGTPYYVTVSAVAYSGYLGSTSAIAGPQAAATQLAPPTGVTLSYGTTLGSIGVTFTAPTGGETYTATACTTDTGGVLSGCKAAVAITSGGQITGLNATQGSAGMAYYVTVSAVGYSGYLGSTSAIAGPQPAMSQVNAPASVTVTSSTTTAATIVATFPASIGTPPSSYTAEVCENYSGGVLSNCVSTIPGYTSGTPITSGLTAGTSYYVQITANPPAGYLAASLTGGPAMAAVQLDAPGLPTLAYGTTSGSLSVTFSAPANAPTGQTYTATACTTDTAGVLSGCNAAQAITSGGQLTGLSATQGSAGTSYYVTVTAVASSYYLASTSAIAGPHAATSQVDAPTGLSITSSTSTAGAITVNFTDSGGIAPSSYTATACKTDTAGVLSNCNAAVAIVPAGQITGLTSGTSYYVEVTAVPPTGYVSATAVDNTSALATTQLSAPTGVTLANGTAVGDIAVSFTAPTGGQSYTAIACTTYTGGVLSGCNAAVAITNGGQLTGLTAGTHYYVTVTATAYTGYLASVASAVAGPENAPTQLNPPVVTAVVGGGNGGNYYLTVTFTPPSPVPGGQTYTAIACATTAMNTGCTTSQAIASGGGEITGATHNGTYYVTVTAVASTGYLGATSSPYGPTTQ